MITIEKQRTVVNVANYDFLKCVITKDLSGKLFAELHFKVTNDKGGWIDTEVIKYEGKDFDVFWRDFDDCTHLYKQLTNRIAPEMTATMLDMDSEFVNEKEK